MAGRLGWFLASKIAKIAKMDGRKRFLASKIAKIAKPDDRRGGSGRAPGCGCKKRERKGLDRTKMLV